MKHDESWILNREREAAAAARQRVEVNRCGLGWAVFQGGTRSSPVFPTREQAMTVALCRAETAPTSRRYG